MDLLLRWMHILGAAVLVGGTIYQRLALAPSLSKDTDDFSAAVRARWSKLVMAASALLLISGIINFVMIVQRFEIPKDEFPGSYYHPIFGIKFLLALAVFFLSSALSGRTALAQRLRQQESMWLSVNMILAIFVVLLAGTMKLADRLPKPSESSRPVPSDSSENMAGDLAREMGSIVPHSHVN